MAILLALLASNSIARAADTYAQPAGLTWAAPEAFKQQLIDSLPPAVNEGLDFNVWAWLGFLYSSDASSRNIIDGQLSLDITKTFGKNVAFTFEGNLIDANNAYRAELEQAFISILLSDQTHTILTFGKFNANIGLEARDFWNRSTGTTSPLFGAQPQDIVGLMITQPIEGTGFKLRPFLSADFQGQCYFEQSPSGGLIVEYATPASELKIQVTNWVGPGYVLYGGQSIRHPYSEGSYGGGLGKIISNWQGPNLTAERASTLYFLNANIVWQPQPDLSLSCEYILGTTHASTGQWGWEGLMGLVQYNLTDRWGLFGRASYLDDGNWLITGQFQHLYELSAGVSYHILDKLEIRGEYRHDHSTAWGAANSVSIHLTVGW
jgi:hypothetical protein